MNSAVCILATGYKIGRECAAAPASGPSEMGTWLMYQTHSYTFRLRRQSVSGRLPRACRRWRLKT